MDAPCHKCEERFIGCHDGCKRYLKFKGIFDEARKKMAEFHDATNYQVTQIEKNRRAAYTHRRK